MTKERLRHELGARRDAIPDADRERAAESVARRLLDSREIGEAESVFLCLSFGSELDTRKILAPLLESGRKVYVPRVVKGERVIHVHQFPCRLETLSFGLVQPVRGEIELAPEEIDRTLDLALVAGLGFDLAGYRLGYGAGYFDRFLAGRRFAALGLAFDAQVVERLPVEPHDVPMRRVFTETRIVEASAG